MNWIDDYLNYTSSQESPELFHRWCAVSVIASVLNRRVWLDRRDSRGIVYFTCYPGQLSVCLVAGAGRCKKSTAVGIAKSFDKAAGVQLFDGKITPERLLNKLGGVGGTAGGCLYLLLLLVNFLRSLVKRRTTTD